LRDFKRFKGKQSDKAFHIKIDAQSVDRSKNSSHLSKKRADKDNNSFNRIRASTKLANIKKNDKNSDIDVAYGGDETGTFTNKSPRNEINLEDSSPSKSKRIMHSTKRMESDDDKMAI